MLQSFPMAGKSIYIFLIVTIVCWGDEPIAPLPESVEYDRKLAAIGKLLFNDPILSKDKKVSCASCHDPEQGGADPRPVSLGVRGKKGNIQSPTVFNARYNFKQFWNGRAETLDEQAKGPIHNPVEMGMSRENVERRINHSRRYARLFRRAYNTRYVTYEQVIEAIVTFEKALVTPNSPFDRYLRGEPTLSDEEILGYRQFKLLGCATCHNGINIGGNSFQKMGIFIPYQYDPSYPDRFSVTQQSKYKNVFKVPTLRNIALTAPYFHDASALTLEEAVKTMSYHNLGTQLSHEDIQLLVTFLKTLTGDMPEVLE